MKVLEMGFGGLFVNTFTGLLRISRLFRVVPMVSLLMGTMVCATSTAVAAPATGGASTFPNRPVRWIVPVAAGGSVDVVARLIGNKLLERWAYPVVVENRVGAGSTIGMEIASKATPDGYTEVFVSDHSVITDGLIRKNLPYDPQKSFAPITVVASTSQLLVINPALPPKSVRELIAYAKARPGRLNYGSAGVGSNLHLAMELLKSITGINVVHIPYKGGPLAVTDLMNGQLSLMFFNSPAALPYIKSGKLTALAISTVKRSPLLPNVPTMVEAGVPGFESDVWYGILAPAKTPSAIIRKIHADIVAVLALQDVRDQLTRMGADPVGNTPEEFAQLIKEETSKWARIIDAANIRIEK